MSAVLDVIQRRRSIRHFEPRPVEPEKLEAMLQAARLAPSSANLQNARVLPIDRPDELEILRHAAYGFGAVMHAPLVLLCMVDRSAEERFLRRMEEMAKEPSPAFDPSKLRTRTGKHFEFKVGKEWSMLNAAIAGEHMVLQATEMGLGTCWVHHFDHDEVRDHFDIPAHLELVSLIAVGYPGEAPHPATMERADVLYLRAKNA